jgi:tetratricopeptide (TPR) repeat protein
LINGIYSMSASANKEALEFFTQALASKAIDDLPKQQISRIRYYFFPSPSHKQINLFYFQLKRTHMGDALFALGRFFDASENFRKAIVLWGLRDPYPNFFFSYNL